MAAIHCGPRPVDLVGPTQLGQQQPVQPLPDAGLVSLLEPSAAAAAGAAAHLARQVVPADAGLEDEQETLLEIAVLGYRSISEWLLVLMSGLGTPGGG